MTRAGPHWAACDSFELHSGKHQHNPNYPCHDISARRDVQQPDELRSEEEEIRINTGRCRSRRTSSSRTRATHGSGFRKSASSGVQDIGQKVFALPLPLVSKRISSTA